MSPVALSSLLNLGNVPPTYYGRGYFPATEELPACPPDFLCPITTDLMSDPVLASDGHTYERRAIQDWFKREGKKGRRTSPKTRENISDTKLIPIRSMKNGIEEWRKTQEGETALKNTIFQHKESALGATSSNEIVRALESICLLLHRYDVPCGRHDLIRLDEKYGSSSDPDIKRVMERLHMIHTQRRALEKSRFNLYQYIETQITGQRADLERKLSEGCEKKTQVTEKIRKQKETIRILEEELQTLKQTLGGVVREIVLCSETLSQHNTLQKECLDRTKQIQQRSGGEHNIKHCEDESGETAEDDVVCINQDGANDENSGQKDEELADHNKGVDDNRGGSSDSKSCPTSSHISTRQILEEGMRRYHGLDSQIIHKAHGKILFALAADNGCTTAEGFCRYYGIGNRKMDYKSAFSILLEEGKKGDAIAQHLVGDCYRCGYGTEKDEKEAFRWYSLSAAQGNPIGLNNVGCCYDAGLGVAKDSVEAVSWYQKAAEQGYCMALYNVGGCYDEGKGGVCKDPDLARQYYHRAADQGYADAISKLAELEE